MIVFSRKTFLVLFLFAALPVYGKTKKPSRKKAPPIKQVEVRESEPKKVFTAEPPPPLLVIPSFGFAASDNLGILSGLGADTVLSGNKKLGVGVDLSLTLFSSGYLFAPCFVIRYQVQGDQYGGAGLTLGAHLGPGFSSGTSIFSSMVWVLGVEGAWHQKVTEFVLFKLLARPLWVDKKLVVQAGMSLVFSFK